MTDRVEELKLLEQHLLAQAAIKQRGGTFDMDDAPEADVLAPFPELREPLQWLGETVGAQWRAADAAAMSSRERHRKVSAIAIITSTAAVVMAIFQLAVKETFPGWTAIPRTIEAIAIACALLAVSLGLLVKFDRKWIGKRHLAERLRMLKFRAVEQLFCLSPDAWQEWVTKELKNLEGADDYRAVKAWADSADPWPEATPVIDRLSDSSRRASMLHYRIKRLEFQARYFDERHTRYEKQTAAWRRLTLPLFLYSVLCVLLHFIFDALHFESAAIWFVAMAAAIPAIGGGMKAWLAAFELPRSASLYAAKHAVLVHAADLIAKDAGNLQSTQSHMAQIESSLEGEHREWIRLLRETEWFV
ncbi:MAG: hypothetical protein JWO97_81 [Acidobacteria bacterium]|nr:hypothetical protein [Acidobacteriota bacterium]